MLLTLTGCATIMNGTSQRVSIFSNPSDACVTVDGFDVGYTPIDVMMKRDDYHVVNINLEGYRPYQITLTQKISGWVFGNILLGGFIGLAVDAVTGGIYTLSPDQVCAQMQCDHMAYSKKTENSFVAVVLEADPSWQKIGQLEFSTDL